MYEVLRAYFEKRFPLTDEQFDFIRKLYIHKKLKKGDFYIREGEVAKYGVFVAKGCLRRYVIDNKGKEHILQFLPETWWVSDIQGLLHGTPSAYFIDALEDSDLLLTDKDSNQKVMEQIPGFAEAFVKGVQKHNETKDKRIVAALSASAEERYDEFLSTYPSIAQRVPQHMLASYLGISPETLSRIRKRRSAKK
jgi:CRP-like cAMP-binding protein